MWTLVVTEEVEKWLDHLDETDPKSAIQVFAAFQVLEQEGPALGRPLVDTIKGSKLKNLKELRPGSSKGTELRILFIFDPLRQAVILVAGDKAGNWTHWYPKAIKQAETTYAQHLQNLSPPPERRSR